MRVTLLQQQTKALEEEWLETGAGVSQRLDSVKHLLWHGNREEALAGMDPKTARKYLKENRLPSELKRERHWRTREDPFSDVWERVRQQIEESPGLEAKTLFVFTWLLRIWRAAHSRTGTSRLLLS
jgi:hypothetical protein